MNDSPSAEERRQRSDARRFAILDAWANEQITDREYESMMIYEISLAIIEDGKQLPPEGETLFRAILAGKPLRRRGKDGRLVVA